jgi:hypothetical protein
VNFFAADLVGSLLAVLLYAPLMLAPGYILAWLADLRGFRRESLLWQLLWALPLSAFATPILAFLFGISLGMELLPIAYGVLAVAALGIAFRSRRKASEEVVKAPRWLWIAGSFWLALAVLSGIDLQWGDRLYAPVWIFDHNLRSAFVGGISRHGLPAVNGVFHPGHDVPLRYHYLWFLSASTVEQLGGAWVTPRQALIAGPVWCGWALIASALLFLRYYLRKAALGRLGLWTTALLATAGLDCIPAFIGGVAFAISGKGWLSPSAEWGSNTITSLPHAVFFEAHHTAGALACCLGFLLLRVPTWGSILLASLCFASTPGLSIYIALAFAPAGVCIFLADLWRKDFAAVRAWLLTGFAALCLCLPYLRQIAGAKSSVAGSFVRFEVRQFFGQLDLPPLTAHLVNLAALPLHYFLESGIVAICAVAFWKRYSRHRGLLALTAIPILIASFLRSGVISNNDLGWRAPLISQFLLLVCFAPPLAALLSRASLLRRRLPQTYRFARAAVVLGFATLAWDFYIMRAFIPLLDHNAAPVVAWLQSEPGRRNHDLRDVYEKLAATLPENAVVQGNSQNEQIYLGSYSQRQSASFGLTCGVSMGGDPEDCRRMQDQLIPVFNRPVTADFERPCEVWNIDVWVVVADDPLWTDRRKYFREAPLVSAPFAEAYRCNQASRTARAGER